MPTPALLELISKLEKASGPDRGLDAEIAKLCAPTDDPKYEAFLNGRDYPDLYTASIDAALTLVPKTYVTNIHNAVRENETFRVAFPSIYEEGAGQYCAEINYDPEPWNIDYCTIGEGCSTVPAIALVIASLRARTAIETKSGGENV